MPDQGSAPNKTFVRSDGTRTGADLFAQEQAAAIGIVATNLDYEAQEMATALSNRLMRDGGNWNTDVPISGTKFTGVGNAAARDQYAAAGQVQDGSLTSATTSGNDTITASLTPAITAYVAGSVFALKAGGTNTGAATLNLNGVGAKAIKKGKTGATDLIAGDFAAGGFGLFIYDGTNMQMLNASVPEFPSGTVMLFVQTSAPTGWTKSTTHNDKALRVVSGSASSGGSSAFTSVFASRTSTGTVGNTTLDITQIPSHTHGISDQGATDGSGPNGSPPLFPMYDGSATTLSIANQIQNAGGGGSHTHTLTMNADNFAVQYVDCIIATKN